MISCYSVSPTITFTPTSSPSNSSTQIRSTKTSTATALPILSDDAIATLFPDLKKNNGGCAYPCWWGITPGETSVSNAYIFLRSISKSVRFPKDSVGDGTLSALFRMGENVLRPSVQLKIKNDEIDVIQWGTQLSVSEFMQRYGQPDEVWISFGAALSYSDVATEIVLFYQDLGLAAHYGYVLSNGPTLTFCPALTYEQIATLHMWNPEFDRHFSEIWDFRNYSWNTFYMIQDISVDELSESDFYASYVNQNSVCFDIYKLNFD